MAGHRSGMEKNPAAAAEQIALTAQVATSPQQIALAAQAATASGKDLAVMEVSVDIPLFCA